jgi:hypothetical protein
VFEISGCIEVHRPGDRWMIRGPIEYVPPVEVEVVMKRRTIPLDEDEGVYVRDIRTGKVRAVIGETYMLNQDEELWEKVLPPAVESLLREDPLAVRSLATTRKPPPRREKLKCGIRLALSPTGCPTMPLYRSMIIRRKQGNNKYFFYLFLGVFY